MLKTNLNYFYSTIANGNMNTNSKFYPDGMTREEIKQDFYERRISLGKEFGFDGTKIIVPSQKARPVLTGKTDEEIKEIMEKYNSKYQDGHYIRINKDMIEGHDDLYYLDFNCDILMMDDTVIDVALAYPVADCAVVFARDNRLGAVAMAHCGGEYIDRGLPGQIVDSLFEEFDSNPLDISVYIGPHAQEHSFKYDCFPKFIQNENRWEDCLRENEGFIHINMSKAILKQLTDRDISLQSIYSSKIDTITDPRFYSNSGSRFMEGKAGRFYTGCFYKEDLVKTKSLSRR